MENKNNTPMHKHRLRRNGVSLKMRIAASKNVRTRYKDGMPITLPQIPWGKNKGSKDE